MASQNEFGQCEIVYIANVNIKRGKRIVFNRTLRTQIFYILSFTHKGKLLGSLYLENAIRQCGSHSTTISPKFRTVGDQ